MKALKIMFILSMTLLSYSSFAQKAKKDTTEHPAYYTCSMHPKVHMTGPGKCPECGMELTLSKKEEMKAKETKTYTCPVHVEVTKTHPGKCPKCGKKLTGSLKEQMKTKEMKIYTCLMHPEIALDAEGKCPKCGADLVKKKD